MRKTMGFTAHATALMFVATSAQAAGTGSTTEPALEEIVVYGQKKAAGEQLQDVPVPISAISGAAIKSAQMVDIRDVGRLVPNAQLDGGGTFPGFANFYIRGIGNNSTVRSIDPAVNIVQDGMVVGYPAGAVLDVFDIEGVEVLRGPQGVLFGRNATGGVVSLRSKRPTGRFGGEASFVFGNAGTVETSAAIEDALIDEKVLARFAMRYRHNDGFFRNRNTGTFVLVPANVNPTGEPSNHPLHRTPKMDELLLKSTWVINLSEQTHLTLLGQYQNYDNGGGASRQYLNSGDPLLTLQTQWGYYPSNKKWSVNMGDLGYTRIEGHHVIAELQQEIGKGVLTAIAAYRKVDYKATLNVTGDPFDTLVFPDADETSDQISFEPRFNLTVGDRIDLVIGGFYFEQDADVIEKRVQRLASSTTPRHTLSDWSLKSKSAAVFGNVDVHVTDMWTISAGARFSRDKKRISGFPLTICAGATQFADCPAMSTVTNGRSWKKTTPRVLTSYKIADDIMLYASYSKGYRAGNFNARALTVGGFLTPADPETVSSFEAGFKTELFAHKLRLNVGAFHSSYDNIQRLVQIAIPGESPAQNLANAAKATIRGVEMEVVVVPLRRLRLGVNVGYLDGEYDSFQNLTLLPGTSVETLKLDRVPKWTVSASGSFDTKLSNGDRLVLQTSYNWRSHVFNDVQNNPRMDEGAFGLWDASAMYEHGRWSIGVFGRNLADEEYAETRSVGIGYQAFGGSPRAYGVQLGYTF